jgi:hypothetical protein
MILLAQRPGSAMFLVGVEGRLMGKSCVPSVSEEQPSKVNRSKNH